MKSAPRKPKKCRLQRQILLATLAYFFEVHFKNLIRTLFLQKETSHCKSSLALGPQGPKHCIFGDHFYSKNARKLRFHVFLLFDARKYMISSFYLKWTEFTRNCEFFSNYGSPGTRTKLEQIYNFL